MLLQVLQLNSRTFMPEEYHRPQAEWRPLANRLCLCPHCGEIWAKILYIDTEDRGRSFTFSATHLPCAEHGGGSIISAYNQPINDALPRDKHFVLYELNLFEKKGDMYYFDGYGRRP